MKCHIRQVTSEYIHPALELAGSFKHDAVANDDYIYAVCKGERLMYIALDDDRIVGVVGERGKGHIGIVFVDGEYRRRGIATELMSRMACELRLRGFNRITLNSSPYALSFCQKFGFMKTGAEQKKDGLILIPMAYEPKEVWDVLDEKGNLTGRLHERGRRMAAGDYHLVVQVWKRNLKGEWLIDKRDSKKGTSMDGKWETTGGAALAGDDSLTAALRETKEELGIDLDPRKGTLFHRTTRHGDDGRTWLQDAWVFEHDCPIEAVRFQEGETCEAMWATADKIRKMMASGEFLSKWFYPYFDDMVEKYEVNIKNGRDHMGNIHTFSVQTRERTQMIDITAKIRGIVRESGISSGVCIVFIPHTTAAVTINENADPDVCRDFTKEIDKIVPWNDGYHHMEGNSAAHLKSSIMGFSELILIENGELVLGTWQGVYFLEYDGARNRKVYVKIMKD